ncbi:hypothetical protein [Psychrobacillus vulpis]|uniref:Uncharacterized protein n=1 Tax=Psychrobacillus vulpis TaxID=2325572 RepID=A0A544TSY5_9BACI|nr:hypothetical protein [Psychrobacillus vulpis]TQR20562.1 hypothetical protein FG384_07375 [Psychrobacillus vulpis]
MELAFVKGKKKQTFRTKETVTGTISILLALFALFMINVGLIMKSSFMPTGIIRYCLIGAVILGFAGLLTKKRNRSFAFLGIAISAFIGIFFFCMIGFAWSINPMP